MIRSAIRELKRSIGPGGRLIITPFRRSAGDQAAMTLVTSIQRTHLTADLVRQLPGQAGFAFKPWATVQRAQERRLARTVAHAYETVPYYRETMRRLGLRPHDLRTATDLARLPIVEREEVQRDPEYFVSRAQPLGRYLRVRSGGSGGAPRQIFYDASSVVANGAFVERHRAVVRKLARTRLRYREAIIESPFGTTQIVHEFLARHVVVPPSLAIRRLYVSMVEPPERNIAALSAFRPDVIDGYGSYLEVFLPRIHSTGRPFAWPRVIVYGSDAMSGAARRMIAESIGVPVLNVDLVPLRIVGSHGDELPAGETGDVVVSNLINRATVLLNYRLGDVARLQPFRCPCGRSLPLMSFIEGRADDWIQTKLGETVHAQAVRTLFTDEDEIYQYQVRQLAPGRFDVEVVVKHGVDRQGLSARLSRKFAGRLGSGTAVRVWFVDGVKRTPGGKVRVVSRSTT